MSKKLNKVMVSLWISNYGEKDRGETTIVDVETFEKYKDILQIIRDKGEETEWNWWALLPQVWSNQTKRFELDKKTIESQFYARFKEPFISADHIIGFFNIFTPAGAGSVFGVKVYDFKEINF